MKKQIIQSAALEKNWWAFLNYKIEKQHLTVTEEEQLTEFIENKRYIPLCQLWRENKFPQNLPVKKVINKVGTGKKRVVYSFEGDEGIFLKFVSFQFYQYDKLFSSNCYAFRRGYGVKEALFRLKADERVRDSFCLKVDISNYFNSINIEKMLDKLSFLEEEDNLLFRMLKRILSDDRVVENGTIIEEDHGAMAGTSFSPFLANLYLADTDAFFEQEKVLYFRYSDDILIFAKDIQELNFRKKQLYDRLEELKLTVNPDKEKIYEPLGKIEFLGFSYQNGEIDLSETTICKMKAKIKRKARALRRWQEKKGLPGEKAAIGFIRAMNQKFYGSRFSDWTENDFSWNRWFFPNLTTDKGLKEIDVYMQQYIRYVVTGRHYKGNYRIKYETLKDWGYRSLVHEYYEWKKG